ncbi:MAG: methionyl-tRNA formyltransferase [Dehalococcoidia bacterium]|nr:methionyl-tRNA formyltransferase [Dehalococcoidia bacterium]
MKIVFMGSPEFAVPILESLVSKHQVLAVYTQPDRPGGRGLESTPSPVKRRASALGLNVIQPTSLKPPEAATGLQALTPEAIIVAAYGLLIPRSILDIPPSGCINVHPSLLPRHRGASPVTAAILSGDGVTGVSIMLLDEGWDTGPVLAQVSTPILATDTTGLLTVRLSKLGAQLLEDTLPRWQAGGIKPQPQDESKATYSRLLHKEEGQLDWTLPAPDLERRVRAFQPWPGCFTRWRGKMLKVLQAEALAGNGEPCKVIGRGDIIGVGAGDGILRLKVVQLEGKKAMDIQDFIRGQPGFIGSILPDIR